LIAVAITALLILQISRVKFLAFSRINFSHLGSASNPGRQRPQRLRREPHWLTA
jgi:hypothetical protein